MNKKIGDLNLKCKTCIIYVVEIWFIIKLVFKLKCQ